MAESLKEVAHLYPSVIKAYSGGLIITPKPGHTHEEVAEALEALDIPKVDFKSKSGMDSDPIGKFCLVEDVHLLDAAMSSGNPFTRYTADAPGYGIETHKDGLFGLWGDKENGNIVVIGDDNATKVLEALGIEKHVDTHIDSGGARVIRSTPAIMKKFNR